MKLLPLLLLLALLSANAMANNGRLEVKNGVITLYVEATQTEYSCNANGSYLFPINELITRYDLQYSNKLLNNTIKELEETKNKLKSKENEADGMKEITINLRQENGDLKAKNEIYYSLVIGSGIAVVIIIMLMAHIVRRKNDE